MNYGYLTLVEALEFNRNSWCSNLKGDPLEFIADIIL